MALPISISMGWWVRPWVHILLGMLVNYQEKKKILFYLLIPNAICIFSFLGMPIIRLEIHH